MARLALNKASLSQQKGRLDTYWRFLPALDLKRRQLIAERNKARDRVATLRAERDRLVRSVGETLPMLAGHELDLDGLAAIRAVRLSEENIVGVLLPVVEAVEIEIREYGLLVCPHWVDQLVRRLAEVLRLEVGIDVAQHRIELLEAALKKVTQRVNLFEKVLIPGTEVNLRRIRIHLGDAERAAVVTAKLAKRKQAMTA